MAQSLGYEVVGIFIEIVATDLEIEVARVADLAERSRGRTEHGVRLPECKADARAVSYIRVQYEIKYL